ncbi:hypothetical protein [Sphingomonas sp. VDB2]|uniref:hypothetical protein n=1 Tax=Sphingomonas sp. VDB2 TaxID=3228751 RepID=UPI003A7F9287
MLLDRPAGLNDLPIVGPVSAGQLRAYVAACRPPHATEYQVNQMMTRVANMMPSPRGLTQEQAEERMMLYRRTLSSHALPDLQAAFDVILRRCRFFPTVAEIEEIVAPIRAKRMARANRAELLILKHEREWREPQPLLTADEAAKLGRILAAPLAGDGEQQ